MRQKRILVHDVVDLAVLPARHGERVKSSKFCPASEAALCSSLDGLVNEMLWELGLCHYIDERRRLSALLCSSRTVTRPANGTSHHLR